LNINSSLGTGTKSINVSGGLRTKGFCKTSHKDKLLISVVTVVFNGEKYLEQTIHSVLDQSYDNVEYIVVDGGSTDRTLEIIKEYEGFIDYWVSEPDTGIYNAMNKGAGLCSGEYIAYLNADDWYNVDTVESVVNKITKDTEFLFGNVSMYINEVGICEFNSNLSNYKRYMPFGHPSLFLKRCIALDNGFNERYKTIADYDLVLRLIEGRYKATCVDKSLANYRVGGASSYNLYEEHYDLYREHFGARKACLYIILRVYDKSLVRLKNFVKQVISDVKLRF